MSFACGLCKKTCTLQGALNTRLDLCFFFSITPFHLQLKDDFLSLRSCSHNILKHSRRSTNDEDLKNHYNKIWLFSMCLTSLLQRNTTKVPRFWHWNRWWNHKTSLNNHHMWFTLKWMQSQSLVVDITYTICTSLFFCFFIVPNVFPWDHPKCSQKYLSFIPYGLPKVQFSWKSWAIGSRIICFYFATSYPKRCYYWGMPNVPKKLVTGQSIWLLQK